MKLKTVFGMAALLGGVAMLTGRAVSNDGGDGTMTMPNPEEMKKMMEEMMALRAPGDHHKHLEPLIGKWDTVMRIWMYGPNMPPSESKGTSESKWVLDGRFVLTESEFKMEFPDPANPGKIMKMTSSGMGLTGYDNFRNMYVGNWASSMGTFILDFKGTRNPKTGVFTYYGEMDEPGVPGIGNVIGRYNRYVTRIVNKDKHILECFDLHAGEDYKAFEIEYTRQK